MVMAIFTISYYAVSVLLNYFIILYFIIPKPYKRIPYLKGKRYLTISHISKNMVLNRFITCGAGWLRSNSYGFSVRRNDHICHCSKNGDSAISNLLFFVAERLKVVKPLSRRVRDSNPRDAINAQRFSRPPHSTALPTLQIKPLRLPLFTYLP